MQKSEVRFQQWEIANSLFSYLKNGKVLTGKVNEIIEICDVPADGYAVAKFLERAESRGHSPYLTHDVIGELFRGRLINRFLNQSGGEKH